MYNWLHILTYLVYALLYSHHNSIAKHLSILAESLHGYSAWVYESTIVDIIDLMTFYTHTFLACSLD